MTPYEHKIQVLTRDVEYCEDELEVAKGDLKFVQTWSKDKISRYNKIWSLRFKNDIILVNDQLYQKGESIIFCGFFAKDIHDYIDGKINDFKIKLCDGTEKSIWEVAE